MSIWDNPEIKSGGEFVKFENVGDTISGTITAIRTQRWDDGKVDPQILLVTDDGEEKTVTAGQVRLKNLLAEQRPEAGDHIRITYTSKEQRAGGKTLKHWDLVVTRGTGTPPPAAAPAAAAVAAPPPAAAPSVVPPPSEAAVDPAAAAAALANLSPAERVALGYPAA